MLDDTTVTQVCLFIAMIFFAVGSFTSLPRVNLISAGLFFVALALLLV